MLRKLTLLCPLISRMQLFHPVHCGLSHVAILIVLKEKLGPVHIYVIYIVL